MQNARYYEIESGHGKLHIHVNFDETGPKRIFVNIPPLGTEISGLAAALGIMCSKLLEKGEDPKKIIKHLNSIKGDKPFTSNGVVISSIPHAIAHILQMHLDNHGTNPPAPLPDAQRNGQSGH